MANKWINYGKEWPAEHRSCSSCKKLLHVSNFHKHKQCKKGYNSVCKLCRKPISSKQYKEKDHKIIIWERAKSRAKAKNLEFNITPEDIQIPKTCPILKRKLIINTKYAPSIDRINPNLGYVKDNIRVISNRANMLKNDATVEELEAVLNDLKVCEIVDL